MSPPEQGAAAGFAVAAITEKLGTQLEFNLVRVFVVDNLPTLVGKKQIEARRSKAGKSCQQSAASFVEVAGEINMENAGAVSKGGDIGIQCFRHIYF